MNKNEKVGEGVYCSPYFENCLRFGETKVMGKRYQMMVQSRIDPEKVKVCEK